MKNFLIVFFLFPILAFSQNQYGLKDCHTDLVFGFDYGNLIHQEDNVFSPQISSIHSFRLGTNLNYPISKRWYLVAGIRLANKSYIQYDIIRNEDFYFPDTLKQSRINDVYAEIPFGTRYMVKTFNRDSRLFIEGGVQFNFYTFTFSKDFLCEDRGEEYTETSLQRKDGYTAFHLSSNIAVGFEYDMSPNLKYYIQPVARFQLMPTYNYSRTLAYHVGVEMGLRF